MKLRLARYCAVARVTPTLRKFSTPVLHMATVTVRETEQPGQFSKGRRLCADENLLRRESCEVGSDEDHHVLGELRYMLDSRAWSYALSRPDVHLDHARVDALLGRVLRR